MTRRSRRHHPGPTRSGWVRSDLREQHDVVGQAKALEKPALRLGGFIAGVVEDRGDQTVEAVGLRGAQEEPVAGRRLQRSRQTRGPRATTDLASASARPESVREGADDRLTSVLDLELPLM